MTTDTLDDMKTFELYEELRKAIAALMEHHAIEPRSGVVLVGIVYAEMCVFFKQSEAFAIDGVRNAYASILRTPEKDDNQERGHDELHV